MSFGARLAGRRTLVTGAHGMLGACLVRSLLDQGAHVRILARSHGRPGNLLTLTGLEGSCEIASGDLADPDSIRRALGGGIDAVFHLAAQTIVGSANASPRETFETNIRGTWNVLEASRDAGVGQVVVAGSDKAYGAQETLPYREDLALRPTHPYEVSKAAADLIARSYFHTYGLPVAVTRFANIYGGGDHNASRLIPEVVAAVLGGRAPVIRSDGTPERDFLYVDDAVAGYLAIADQLADGRCGGEAFNGGGDQPHSVREIVDLVLDVAGSDLVAEYRGTGTPSGEIDRQYVDSSRLREQTGWSPQVGLREGLARTVEWYRAHPQVLAP